ncbi:MAG: hypothetical protein ACJ8CR_13720 [Roseiflexaceae bacterium]
MNRSRISILLALLISLHVVAIAGAQPPVPAALVGSAFTYQGRLRTGTTPVNNGCDFQFSLWNAASGGTRIGGVLSTNNVTVSEGRFTVSLDFGAAAFDGNGRWLQVAVRCPTGVGGFTTLLPRQPLAPAPYAVRATTAGSVPWSRITGIPAGFADGIDNGGASYSAGLGLTLVGTQFQVAVPLNLSGSITSPIIAAQSSGADGTGLSGKANNGTAAYGVWGVSSDGLGVVGEATGGLGVAGLSTSNIGVYGESGSGVAMRGVSTSNIGVYGSSTSNNGVRGFSTNSQGVYGSSTNSQGVRGVGTSGIGVYGTSTTNAGMRGDSTSGFGMFGVSFGSASTAGTVGVYGPAGTFTYYTAGVAGSTTVSNGTGVSGFSPTGVGVRGVSTSGYAGYFQGNVYVNGTLSKAAGSFKIDHPLDPANKYLSHSFVESPDMMNIYNGNATLDKGGQAVVQLPAYFQALNQEFRYQLTAIGAPGPNLYIASEIKNNQFTVAGGKPGMRVSWQVTGIRHDPYAEQNRIQVEEAKPAEERGKYLYPQGYGQPATQSVDYIQAEQAKQAQSTVAAPVQPEGQPVAPKSLRSELASKRP